MLKGILASIITLAFLTQTSLAQNQEANRSVGDWSIVELLTTGEKLEIELKSGNRIKGKLANVSNAGLIISGGGKNTDLGRDEVSRVYQLVGRRRGHSALRGTAIGVSIGAGIGLILYLPYRSDISGWVPPVFGAIGGGIGAGVGAVFSAGQKRVLIYQAR